MVGTGDSGGRVGVGRTILVGRGSSGVVGAVKVGEGGTGVGGNLTLIGNPHSNTA